MYFVYIAKLDNNKFYTGFTSDIVERIKRHKRKNPTLTTTKNKIIELVFYVAFKEKKRALDFEKYLKSSSGFAFRNKRLV